jgi:MSHA biogenesis protein MshM
MYIEHFGLTQYLFSLTPNPWYFLKLPSHQRAFDFVVEALQDGSSFTKIVGEVGTGKTMLCRKVLAALDAIEKRYVTAFIPNPVLDEESIMYAIAEELHLRIEHGASTTNF